MPLQNRVTPFGNLVAVEGRGLLMGNRGRLHDAERRIVRYAQGRRWIACLTSFRGRRRTVMSPGLYTELFFLDEAVALAAGHRPCAECRRDDYTRFRAAWARAVSEDVSADGMDMKLDADRLAGRRTKRTYSRRRERPSGWRIRRHRRRGVARLAGRAPRVGAGRVRRAARAGRRPRHGDHAAGHRRRDPRRIPARHSPERGPRRRPRPAHRPGPGRIRAASTCSVRTGRAARPLLRQVAVTVMTISAHGAGADRRRGRCRREEIEARIASVIGRASQ